MKTPLDFRKWLMLQLSDTAKQAPELLTLRTVLYVFDTFSNADLRNYIKAAAKSANDELFIA